MNRLRRARAAYFWGLVVIILLVIGYVGWSLTAAIPSIKPVASHGDIDLKVPASPLAWPAYGQAAIGLGDSGVVATNGPQTSVPMASTAKLITALCVLNKYPLALSQSGPLINITSADIAIYNKYQSEDGSDLPVTSGEQLSEYQMLAGMLLPSADNIADSLAIWSFGSLFNYNLYANQYLKTHHLSATHVGSDASGFDPSSTTNASDLVKIGQLAMANPVIATLVGQTSLSGIPNVGTIKNINYLLGQDQVIGIKTGNTDQAGGVFLSASRVDINNQPLNVITAVMQAPSLRQAISDSKALILSAQTNFASPAGIVTIHKGSMVGQYQVPWSDQTLQAVATQSISFASWGSSTITESISLKPISPKTAANQVVGSITTASSVLKTTNKTAAILNTQPTPPSRWWILLHPQSFIHL